MTTMTEIDQAAERRDALVGRLFNASVETLEVFTIYLGERLGLYRGLADLGVATSAELAAASGNHERYVREWLEQQAAASLLECLDPTQDAASRRYRLPDGHGEVLLDRDSLNYFSGILRLVVGATSPLAALQQAFRSGGGVPYPDYGVDTLEGIGDMNRPMFLNLLGTQWLPSVPDVHARLQADPPARVADVGCGLGWSSIAISRAYPNAQVDGFDVDPASIDGARANAAAAGLEDRLHFSLLDASDPVLSGRYDLVTAFETIHDMARPVEALRNLRELVREEGTVIVADERVGDTFAAPGTEIERFNYGFSVLHCLAVGMAESPSAGTGTVLRLPLLRQYALEAGFRDVEVLPIDNDFWRFYRLVA